MYKLFVQYGLKVRMNDNKYRFFPVAMGKSYNPHKIVFKLELS